MRDATRTRNLETQVLRQKFNGMPDPKHVCKIEHVFVECFKH